MTKLAQDLRARVRGQQSGFTLVELLIVLLVIGILLAIAFPSFLGFRSRASSKAASSNVRSAIPSIQAYYADNDTYVGATNTALKAGYDSGISPTVVVSNQTTTTYTLTSVAGGCTATVNGPSGAISVSGSGCS